MTTSEKQHAEVTQEHKDLVVRIGEAYDGHTYSGRAEQILADYAAEVERKARLDEHDSLCVECSYVRLNGKGGLTQRCSRGAELERKG